MAAVDTSCVLDQEKQQQQQPYVNIKRSSSLKRVASLNLRERQTCTYRTKLIEMERKSLRTQLTREEEELKGQLLRLQAEKRALEEYDLPDEEFIDSVSEAADTWDLQDDYILQEDDVINPYPVTIGRTRKTSVPICGRGLSPSRSWLLARGRRHSNEFDDQLSVSSCIILPPITKSIHRNTYCRETPQLMKGSPRESVISLHSAVSGSNMSNNINQDLWVGDPEAISSIRRSKKPVCKPKLELVEHQWARSRSLKENLKQEGKRKSVSLSRSNSLKEPHRQLGYHSPNSRENIQGNLSRCSSVKCNRKRTDCTNEDTTTSISESSIINEVNIANLNISEKNIAMPKVSSTNENSQDEEVWDWIKDVDSAAAASRDTEEIDTPRKGRPRSSTNKSPLRIHPPATGDACLDNPGSDVNDSIIQSPKQITRSKSSLHKKVPSPSHLSVERCFEILASSPLGAGGNQVKQEDENIK